MSERERVIEGAYAPGENRREIASTEEAFLRPEFGRTALTSSCMKPCRIRILIVADGIIDYDSGEFSLFLLVKALLTSDDPKVSFTVKRAHREESPSADIRNFRFDDPEKFDPDCYDEIWLFGYNVLGPFLEKEEVIALWRFMDSGKGVFATGDHEDLGAALCGSVPRVRTMRKWAAEGGVGPASPDENNAFRHDSLRKGDDHIYSSLDERDDLPQIIFPRVYSKIPEKPNSSDCCPKVYPHPLLCGRDETILKFLPDHMHEGECYVPKDDQMNEVEHFDGEDHPEYPKLSDGKRLQPEVVAFSKTPEPHVTFNIKDDTCHPATQVVSLGVIGSYDGHLVDVGRVVVDSSFHHFIDLNLSGFENSTDITSADKGRNAYKRIREYFSNIGRWLAPESIQGCMSARALWQARWTYPLIEDLTTFQARNGLEKPPEERVAELGRAVRGALAAQSTPCLSWAWTLDLLRRLQPEKNIDIERRYFPGPWTPRSDSSYAAAPPVNTDLLLYSVLGSVMLLIVSSFPDRGREMTEKFEKELLSSMTEGTKKGIAAFNKLLSDYKNDVQLFSSSFTSTFN